MDGEISATQLEAQLDDEPPLIVDIRSPDSFAREHIPESVNVPLSRLPSEVERVADADHVVTVCPHGKASIRAAKLVGSFAEFDGRVESLAGGLEGWDGPVNSETADASPDAPF
jgi:rhodanese-related sulfurtransferase